MSPRKLLPNLLVLLFIATLLLSVACKSGTASQDSNISQAPAVQAGDGKINIAAVGDIMLGSTYPANRGLPPQDGAKMLADVAPVLSAAEIAFGNLEGPLLEGGTTSKCGPGARSCFTFRVPTRYGKYLKEAGFDVMSLANNHASDFGAEGRQSTRKVLEGLGIAHSGGDLNDIAYLTVEGKKIAVIAFATNAISYNLNDVENAKKAVADVATKADLVIVSFHGGAEGAAAQRVPRGPETFVGEARGNLREFAHAVVDAGADLVLGHGPHVVRGMEVYKKRLIAYSLGNFAFYGFPFAGPSTLSMILEVNLAPDGALMDGLIHPVKQEGQAGPRMDKSRTVIPLVRQLSTDDFGASAPKIGNDGTISPS